MLSQKIHQVLGELGLIDSEIAIYLQLIRTATMQPASTIAQRLNMNRTSVYKSLLKLTKMGLVGKSMKHGIICFFAEDPEKTIESHLEQRKSKLNFISSLFLDSISDLRNLKQEELYTPKMRYYEGLEGVKRVYEDTLTQKEAIFAFENVDVMDPGVQSYLWEDYVPRRVEGGIFAQVITPKSLLNEDYRSKDKTCLRETRFLDLNAFPMEIEMNIYDKKVAFLSYKTDEMYAVILESASIANSMKAIFSACWKMAK